MFSVIYSDKSAFNIVSQLGLNNVKINSEMNTVFNFLKFFYFCLIYYYETSLINFVKNAVTSVKNLINC